MKKLKYQKINMNNLLILSLFLSIFGLFNLLGIDRNLFYRQLFALFLAFTVFFITKKIGRDFFERNINFFYWFFIFILIITFFIGKEVKGSRRWLDLFFFRFQPSEIFKIFFILYFSSFFAQKKFFSPFEGFFKGLLLFLIPTILIFKQPDLGNALVYGFIFFTFLFFSDFPKRYIFYLSVFLILFFPLFWQILADYQKMRLISFFNPHLDKQGTAYNISQAVITIGSGGFFGKGLGLGTQSRLHFLPENKTDFAFASLVEQFGFFGGIITLFSYGLIFYLIIKKIFRFFFIQQGEDRKNFFYCLGLLSYLAFQFFVNVGMNLGIVPIAGVALPFISYGGSAVLTLLFGFALLP